MRIRPSISNARQPKCYIGSGLYIRAGHWGIELNPSEMMAVVKLLTEMKMVNPAYLKKLMSITETGDK